MANIPFDTMYDQLLPYLPGAETPIVDSQLRKALRLFMTRTTAIREVIPFSTTALNATYQITPATPDTQVASIIKLQPGYLQRPLPPAGDEVRLRPMDPARPQGWYSMIPNLLSLWPTPDAVYTFEVEVALTLDQSAVEFPEELMKHYAEAIAAGTIASMYAMPGKPWTQRDAAAEAQRIFSRTISTVRGALRDGGQPNQGTFRPLYSFGGRRR